MFQQHQECSDQISYTHLCKWIHLTWLTLGAGAAPSLTQRGTAVGPQSGTINVDLTTAIHYLEPASSFTGFCWHTAKA